MLTFYGHSSLTPTERKRLNYNLEMDFFASVKVREVADIYFLDIYSPLSAEQEEHLHDLLRIIAQPSPQEDSLDLYVVPRQGTPSSWSSKARDILHICGFNEVLRIERGRFYRIWYEGKVSQNTQQRIKEIIHDRMVEEIFTTPPPDEFMFQDIKARLLQTFDMDGDAHQKLKDLNQKHGFAMSDDELKLLADYYQKHNRDASDAELMMFAQINSEHCRHKLFNALWTVDGKSQKESLFDMVRYTKQQSPEGILSAYSDNAAIIQGHAKHIFTVNPEDKRYHYAEQEQAISIKVETHNHPTAIAPAPGAATGSGGEIRDESATGRGGRPKAGFTGFCVSEIDFSSLKRNDTPSVIAAPLDIMIEAPIGAASFNNEFGRPAICGYFRTFECKKGGVHYGYDKPIMLAGGLGSIAVAHTDKQKFQAGTPLVVLGGPAMLIGLGGSTASSLAGGSSDELLDFASVQRDNAEMQRRCQEVINCCTADGEHNPIISIHDVGAGGLSNAFPELVHDAGLGAVFNLDKIPRDDSSLSPMELWCNESQERYVMAINPEDLDRFFTLCERERCPAAVAGHATEEQRIVLCSDGQERPSERSPIDMPMDALFGYLPPAKQTIKRLVKPYKIKKILSDIKQTIGCLTKPQKDKKILEDVDLHTAAGFVLSFPTVACKSFLITIGDRSVGGLVARDQMVGPWQVPVSDVAVTAASYESYQGEAMAIGERPPIALDSPSASARIAVTEAILNILAADIEKLSDIKLSANWMVAAKAPGQAKALFDAVQAVAKELCPALGIAIPVGKDSVSMQMASDERHVTSPLSLVISAFAPVNDIRKTLTPQLQPCIPGNCLFFIDLSAPGNKLGGSCLMQALEGSEFHGFDSGSPDLSDGSPDLSDPEHLIGFISLLRSLREQEQVLAYHDRSDGGLFACLAEMAFAGHCGIRCEFDCDKQELLRVLFSEGPGVVLQVTEKGAQTIKETALQLGLEGRCSRVGEAVTDQQWTVKYRNKHNEIQEWSESVMQLKESWLEPSQSICQHRDNPASAFSEVEAYCDPKDLGLLVQLSFELAASKSHKRHTLSTQPKFAILRDQGVNGQVEMAAAFDRAGFATYDVHMSDLIAGNININEFNGLAVCGGFSYGDVLGAGVGWAHSILSYQKLRDMFEKFFADKDKLTLGICNGCQMLSQLKDIIPGAQHWPHFERNESNVFESRFVQVKVMPSPSLFLQGMEDSLIPITIAHGEGRAVFPDQDYEKLKPLTCMRYVDHNGKVNHGYPYNPNGSRGGAAGFCNEDGRVTIMMPHPERCFRSVQCSWHPPEWGEDGAWMQLFYNAMRFYQ